MKKIILIIGSLILYYELILQHANAGGHINMLTSFEMQHNTEIKVYPTSLIGVYPLAHSLLSCCIQCIKHEHCLSFYYTDKRFDEDHYPMEDYDFFTPKIRDLNTEELQGNTGDFAFNCILFSTRLHTSQITTGTASLGTIKEVRTGSDYPPIFPPAELMYLTKTQIGITAIYNCVGGNNAMTSFGWLYDKKKRKWPKISTAEKCISNICDFVEASGSILELVIDSDSGYLVLSVFCAQSERSFSVSASCNTGNGKWYIGGNDIGLACVSPICYKLSEYNVAHYSGVVSKSTTGKICERWEGNQLAISRSYQYDDYSVTHMENFCRDQTGEGRPYCIVPDQTQSSYTTEFCDVPMCSLDPVYNVPIPHA